MGQVQSALQPQSPFQNISHTPHHPNLGNSDLENNYPEPEVFQIIDTDWRDLGEKENWTLRICPAFVQTINEKDTGLLCS